MILSDVEDEDDEVLKDGKVDEDGAFQDGRKYRESLVHFRFATRSNQGDFQVDDPSNPFLKADLHLHLIQFQNLFECEEKNIYYKSFQ